MCFRLFGDNAFDRNIENFADDFGDGAKCDFWFGDAVIIRQFFIVVAALRRFLEREAKQPGGIKPVNGTPTVVSVGDVG